VPQASSCGFRTPVAARREFNYSPISDLWRAAKLKLEFTAELGDESQWIEAGPP